jgi:hypothetical protein
MTLDVSSTSEANNRSLTNIFGIIVGRPRVSKNHFYQHKA